MGNCLFLGALGTVYALRILSLAVQQRGILSAHVQYKEAFISSR